MPTAELPTAELGDTTATGRENLLATLAEHATAADREGRPFPEVLAAVRASDVTGLVAPTHLGGAGAAQLTVNRRVAEIARHDPSTAIIVFQHLAVSSRIVEWGTDGQQRELLPRLASGEWLAASAWSESGAGAAKRNLATVAEERPDGSWSISGGKAFTTGAGLADVYLVLAQTTRVEDDGEVYGSSGQSFFLIPADTPGITPDTGLDLVGMRASATGFIELEDCVVPADAMLGPRDGANRVIAGVRQSGATLGAVAVGIAEAAWDHAFAAARKRGLLDHQGLRFRLAEVRTRIEAARALVERAGRCDAPDPGAVTLHSKIFAAEVAEEVVQTLARLLGSAGYVISNPINRMARDARAVALMGPTNDLARELVSTPWTL
ncbi:acyl-CoA dehydrogenase family protein [Streptomyces sp. CBMA156]|uniref:acyl-CoA dehydrogenase family protein n=1 Tax=Streptomyces sp. CBMA156 TaxID=1930280 RepID=UPI001661E2D9|nr:acyl-CoA dehydrogenase family protein [Streptomyces sp. CBMA156]